MGERSGSKLFLIVDYDWPIERAEHSPQRLTQLVHTLTLDRDWFIGPARIAFVRQAVKTFVDAEPLNRLAALNDSALNNAVIPVTHYATILC
jgi:hypothetical protein